MSIHIYITDIGVEMVSQSAEIFMHLPVYKSF